MSELQETSINFNFLKDRYPDSYRSAYEAEKLLTENHIESSCINSRKFLEKIVEFLYIKFDIPSENKSLFEKINEPLFKESLDNPKKVIPLMHSIRIIGNNAAHGNHYNNGVSAEDSLKALNRIYNLAVWFCKFNDKNFKYSEPFRDPSYSCSVKKEDRSIINKKTAMAKVMAEYTKLFIDEKKANNNSTTEESQSYDINPADRDNNESEENISITDVFSQYSLTDDQNKLVNEIEKFLNNEESDVFLLKGYAGTGKTFITKGIVEFLHTIKREVVLLAPTGKAAKILEEKSLSYALTIHSCIYENQTIRSSQNEDDETVESKAIFSLKNNRFSTDAVYIVDESSMISDFNVEQANLKFGSGRLLTDFFRFVNINNSHHISKIIFIGDPAQLPPVSRDKTCISPALNDEYLHQHFNVCVNTYTLSEVVRQKGESGILKEATAIRKAIVMQKFDKLKFIDGQKDLVQITFDQFANTYNSICNGEISKDIITIASTNEETYKLNNRIRNLIFNKKTFYNEDTDSFIPLQTKDLLLITKTNRYDGVVLKNGEIIEVSELIGESEVINIDFSLQKDQKDTIVTIPLIFQDVVLNVSNGENFIPHKCKLLLTRIYERKLFTSDLFREQNIENLINIALHILFSKRHPNITAKKDPEMHNYLLEADPYFNAVRVLYGYAITCHKAQGSEWKNVFIKFSSQKDQHTEEFFRWTYTAITRAANNLYVIDPPSFEVLSTIKFI